MKAVLIMFISMLKTAGGNLLAMLAGEKFVFFLLRKWAERTDNMVDNHAIEILHALKKNNPESAMAHIDMLMQHVTTSRSPGSKKIN